MLPLNRKRRIGYHSIIVTNENPRLSGLMTARFVLHIREIADVDVITNTSRGSDSTAWGTQLDDIAFAEMPPRPGPSGEDTLFSDTQTQHPAV